MRATLRILAAASLAAATFNSFAATDGTLGSSSSSGNFDINLTVPTQIIVRKFEDMSLNTSGAAPGSSIDGDEEICVGGIGFASYGVSLSSQNGSTGGSGANPFQLNGVGENLLYNAYFIDSASAAISSAIEADTNGDISGSFPRNENTNCTTDNARVFVSIPATSWESADETSYSDTLTVTVTAL